MDVIVLVHFINCSQWNTLNRIWSYPVFFLWKTRFEPQSSYEDHFKVKTSGILDSGRASFTCRKECTCERNEAPINPILEGFCSQKKDQEETHHKPPPGSFCFVLFFYYEKKKKCSGCMDTCQGNHFDLTCSSFLKIPIYSSLRNLPPHILIVRCIDL